MTLVNICVCTMGPLKYIQQRATEIKEEKHSNTIIVGTYYYTYLNA